ncbi:c-type cytochrome [Roseibium aggregatum]|uniref:C-type cytochrome n=1 Tax=Roseibium aggregatum TaxID=187304 RepID=A0A939EGQ9_9HYPH|nr:c-type cytochrome [Roseibium aggregatum]MBN9671903.1 c-type cytochrome [Roseibium aggregatum]
MPATRPGQRFDVVAFAKAAPWAVFFLCQTLAAGAAEFQTLKGHGGPIMDVAVSKDSGTVATASFDNSVGVWSGRTAHWLEGHAAAVKVVAFIDPERLVSAGDDNALILWDLGNGSKTPLEGHTAKVMGLAVSPDKDLIASASWDTRIGLWPVAGGEPDYLNGHTAGVNKVAFSRDGKWLFSASVDGSIKQWDLSKRAEKQVVDRNGFGINVIALGGFDGASETWIAYGSQDGVTRVVDLATGERLHEFAFERRPILSMTLSPDGSRLATGDGHGYITVLNTENWSIETDFKAALKGPIWALAFSKDGAVLHAGGIENIVYSWPVADLARFDPMATETPEFLKKPEEMSNGERQFARKCSICHALTPDGGRKAGPTLHEVFGRRAGSLPGYSYSQTLLESGIVWSEETIDGLFLDGPDHYIPGSKMPMQRIVRPADRDDLIDYLKAATAVDDSDGEME